MDRALGFSTLGCPGALFEELAAIAGRHGACGLELRCYPGEPIGPDATVDDLRRARERAEQLDLTIICLDSYVEVASPDPGRVDDLLHHAQMAATLGAGAVRVFGCHEPGPESHRLGVDALRQAAPTVEEIGVRVVVEAHDAFPTGRAIADLLDEVDSPAYGAIWDVLNPWRHGEPIAQTAANLGPWLHHVQLKDVASPEDVTPVLPGRGVLPLCEVLDVLDSIDYRGWLVLEWERAWHPQVPSVDEALAALREVVGR